MANPRGQQRDKPFLAALRLEIKSAQDDGRLADLRAIARKLLATAASGDVQAIKEVADRLDGKPAQAVEFTGDLVHHFAEVPRTSDDEKWLKLVDNRGSVSGVPNPARNLS